MNQRTLGVEMNFKGVRLSVENKFVQRNNLIASAEGRQGRNLIITKQ